MAWNFQVESDQSVLVGKFTHRKYSVKPVHREQPI